MERNHQRRQRIKARDGSSFRLEWQGEQILINGERAQVHALRGTADVELVTPIHTVRVSGAQYWELFAGDAAPTRTDAGLLLARWHE